MTSVEEQIQANKKEKEIEDIIEGYIREYLDSKGIKLSTADFMYHVDSLTPIKSKGELTNRYIKLFNRMRERGVWKESDGKWWNLDSIFEGRFKYSFSFEGEIEIDKRKFYSWLKKNGKKTNLTEEKETI